MFLKLWWHLNHLGGGEKVFVNIETPRPCSQKFSFAESAIKLRESTVKQSHWWFWYHQCDTCPGRSVQGAQAGETLVNPQRASEEKSQLQNTCRPRKQDFSQSQSSRNFWSPFLLPTPHSSLGGPWSPERRKREERREKWITISFLDSGLWPRDAGKYLTSTSLFFNRHISSPR